MARGIGGSAPDLEVAEQSVGISLEPAWVPGLADRGVGPALSQLAKEAPCGLVIEGEARGQLDEQGSELIAELAPLDLSASSRSALGYATSANNAAFTLTESITQGAGNDVLNLSFGGDRTTTVALGAGSDTVFLAAAYTEGAGGTVAGQNIGITSGAVSRFTTFSDFGKGVDHINVEVGAGAYGNTFGNAGYIGATSLTAAATTAASLTGATNSTVFEYSGNTYIFTNDAAAGFSAADTLVQLTGVTGLSVNNTAGATSTGDIHFG